MLSTAGPATPTDRSSLPAATPPHAALAVDHRLQCDPLLSLFLTRTSTHSFGLTWKFAPYPSTSPTCTTASSRSRALTRGRPGWQTEPALLPLSSTAWKPWGLWKKCPRSHHLRVKAPVTPYFPGHSFTTWLGDACPNHPIRGTPQSLFIRSP